MYVVLMYLYLLQEIKKRIHYPLPFELKSRPPLLVILYIKYILPLTKTKHTEIDVQTIYLHKKIELGLHSPFLFEPHNEIRLCSV